MQLFDIIQTIERINRLIRLKATGSPSELAQKLELCERQVYRIMEELKALGLPIQYCKKRKTYYYTNDVFMKFEVSIIEGDDRKKIIGGFEKRFDLNDIFWQTDILGQFTSSSLYQVSKQRS